MEVRRAVFGDALDILAWRNDPQTRAMSKINQPIGTDAHLRWFANAIVDNRRLILIGEDNNIKIGMVRFDQIEQDIWTVSINVAPASRGLGHGFPFLSRAVQFLACSAAPSRINAEVMVENLASHRIFEKCGFVRQGSDNGFDQLVLLLT
jgi:RimJ/RimL family protein N-acetyltransferase